MLAYNHYESRGVQACICAVTGDIFDCAENDKNGKIWCCHNPEAEQSDSLSFKEREGGEKEREGRVTV